MVVRTHPGTGRRALYGNPGHALRLACMTVAGSTPLLDVPSAHQVLPEFTCRFSWMPGSLAFRDNRCVLHNRVNDDHRHRRVMRRVTLARDVPQ